MGRMVSAAATPMDHTTCQKAFADGFYDEPADNIMAFSDHARDNCTLTPRENMESVLLSACWQSGH